MSPSTSDNGSRQTSIPHGDPVADLENRECEWCGKPATHAIEIPKKINRGTTGSGMFMYACDEDEDRVRRIAAGKVNPPKLGKSAERLDYGG